MIRTPISQDCCGDELIFVKLEISIQTMSLCFSIYKIIGWSWETNEMVEHNTGTQPTIKSSYTHHHHHHHHHYMDISLFMCNGDCRIFPMDLTGLEGRPVKLNNTSQVHCVYCFGPPKKAELCFFQPLNTSSQNQISRSYSTTIRIVTVQFSGV